MNQATDGVLPKAKETAEQRERRVRAEIAKLIVRGLYDIQKLRIQLDLRVQRLVRDEVMTAKDAKGFFEVEVEQLEGAEQEMEAKVARLIKKHPVWKDYLKYVKGIGPRLGGLCIALIGDVRRFDNVAKLWAYCGLHTIDGKAVRRVKGQKANWSGELKTTAWKIANSFIKAGGPYRDLYDRYRQRIVERELNRGNAVYSLLKSGKYGAQEWKGDKPPDLKAKPEWTIGRIHNMALRYIAKMFLSHLWEAWRELEGVSVRDPYALAYLGHTTKVSYRDYMSEKKKKGKKKKVA